MVLVVHNLVMQDTILVLLDLHMVKLVQIYTMIQIISIQILMFYMVVEEVERI